MFTLKKTFTGLPETERGKPFVLKADPKGQKLLYGIANNVVVRSIENPGDTEVITHHTRKVTCASYAPSGFYIASADAGGFVKIWDTVNVEHLVKWEYQLMAGVITDVSWSPDNKKIAVAGFGRDKFGNVISVDTGTSVGGITQHLKNLLSLDYRPKNPFAIITGGEDMQVMFHKGPPFQYKQSHKQHTNFVNCVRFNFDGSLAASAGMDGKIYIYDGATHEMLYELVAEGFKRAHEGGVYAVSWSPCGKKLLSASGDKSCKVWNVEEKKCETVFPMGKDVKDQQLSCLWVQDKLISLSLSGRINFLDIENPTVIKRSIWGHNKGIISVDLTEDKKVLLTGSYDGILNHWDVSTGECVSFTGHDLPSQVTDIAHNGDGVTVICVGKTVHFATLSTKEFDASVAKTEKESFCVIMTDPETAVVGCIGSIDLFRGKKKVGSTVLSYDVVAIASYSNNNCIVACGSDKKAHFFNIQGDSLVADTKVIDFTAPLSHVTVSHNEKFILFSTTSQFVHLYDAETLKEERSWAAQANRVNNSRFSDDDSCFATCGVDGGCAVFKTSERNYRLEHRQAHRMYNCCSVFWTGPTSLLTVGQQDLTIKFWDVSL